MVTYAVVKTGGKQYLVKEGMTITVDQLDLEKGKKSELESLLRFNEDGKVFELGQPLLKEKVSVEVIDNVKGDKIRIAKFKAKSRYRKVRGFRSRLTKLKILKI
jgi:large subunit ribosomal protein L21